MHSQAMKAGKGKPKVTTGGFAAWRQEQKEREQRMAAAVQADPRAAIKEAWQAMDYGVDLLLKVVDDAKLKEATPWLRDDALRLLSVRVDCLANDLARRTRAGDSRCAAIAWYAALALVEGIHFLALKQPERLRGTARRALFLPSLRATARTFDHDFPVIADAIQLSADCTVDMGPDARHQLDQPVTRFVAGLIDTIEYWKEIAEGAVDTVNGLRAAVEKNPTGEFGPWRRLTLEEHWNGSYPRHPEKLAYRNLPPLTKATCDEWWNLAVKPMLEHPDMMIRIRGSRLHEEIVRGTETGKDYEVRDELKRRCRPKLKSLAREAKQPTT